MPTAAFRAAKAAAAKKTAQEDPKPSGPIGDQAKPFFPYARYTSLVGVHASLLAFTAIFLPRSAFADLSSPSVAAARGRREPMVMMTESPARTLAWLCLGTLVLQLWWASWMREWKLEASVYTMADGNGAIEEDETKKAERVLRQKEWDSQKASVAWKATLATLAASVAFYLVIIAFGAPLTSHVPQTAILSLLVSLLAVFTPAYVLGPPTLKSDTESLVRRLTWIRLFAELSIRSPIERALVYPSVGALVGAWSGAIPIGLDWEQPWQAWPLTPAWGALGGYVVGSLLALLVTNLKQIVEVGILATRQDDQTNDTKKSKKKTA